MDGKVITTKKMKDSTDKNKHARLLDEYDEKKIRF
jgi:hypothetical protein